MTLHVVECRTDDQQHPGKGRKRQGQGMAEPVDHGPVTLTMPDVVVQWRRQVVEPPSVVVGQRTLAGRSWPARTPHDLQTEGLLPYGGAGSLRFRA